MNGPNVMYRMKPIVNISEKIDIPKCMYRMKNIQQAYLNSRMEQQINKKQSSSISEQCPLPEMTALENRQEAILAQLAELKNQLANLRAHLNQPIMPKVQHEKNVTVTRTSELMQNGMIHDIVINASPKYPPFSLAALRRLWGDGLKIGIKCHVHSSILTLPDSLGDFMSSVTNEKNEDKLPLLNVILIWKDVGPNTELVVSPVKHITIKGEVNILRYLSRLGPPKYNYELSNGPESSTRVDSILDTCYNMARSRTVKNKQALTRVLNSHLGKNQFLAGSDISIADIAAWSVLKQMGGQNLTNNMTNWLQRCSQALNLDV